MWTNEFSFTKTLPGVSYEEAKPRITAALKKHGFGVLTEIDVKSTMREKLDVDFRKYTILGACNPPIAHRALSAVPAVGLLLPCNVVVTEDDQRNAVVSLADPEAMLKAIGDVPELRAPMHEAREKLLAAFEEL